MPKTKPQEGSSVALLFSIKFLYFQKIIVIYNINRTLILLFTPLALYVPSAEQTFIINIQAGTRGGHNIMNTRTIQCNLIQ